MSSERVSRQHPAARARGADLAFTAHRLIEQRSHIGRSMGVVGPETAVAMATMAVRGRQHRTRQEFAAAYGLTHELVCQLESGAVTASQVPVPLLVLTPLGRILEGWPGVTATRPAPAPAPSPSDSRPSLPASAPARSGR